MADEEVAATMKDLKEMQTSLTSIVDKRMDELRELIAQLASTQASTLSASNAPSDHSLEKVNVEEDGVDEGEGEGKESGDKDKDKNKIPKKPPPSNGKGEKEDYHAVPPSYTPDPLISHPHINRSEERRVGKECRL